MYKSVCKSCVCSLCIFVCEIVCIPCEDSCACVFSRHLFMCEFVCVFVREFECEARPKRYPRGVLSHKYVRSKI
jgi:hypothetical protein